MATKKQKREAFLEKERVRGLEAQRLARHQEEIKLSSLRAYANTINQRHRNILNGHKGEA